MFRSLWNWGVSMILTRSGCNSIWPWMESLNTWQNKTKQNKQAHPVKLLCKRVPVKPVLQRNQETSLCSFHSPIFLIFSRFQMLWLIVIHWPWYLSHSLAAYSTYSLASLRFSLLTINCTALKCSVMDSTLPEFLDNAMFPRQKKSVNTITTLKKISYGVCCFALFSNKLVLPLQR